MLQGTNSTVLSEVAEGITSYSGYFRDIVNISK